DLVVRYGPKDAALLSVSAFRNPEGVLPDGLALAPWERPSEIPPEKDGFFLLEVRPPSAAPAAATRTEAARPPVALVVLFDTSLRQRLGGVEGACGMLVRVLQSLGKKDRFALVPFDRRPADAVALQDAAPEAVEAALTALRARPLGAGSDVPAALAAARTAAGGGGRLLLFTDGPPVASPALATARGPRPLFTALTGEGAPEAVRAASPALLVPGSVEAEAEVFLRRQLGPLEKAPAPRATGTALPFRIAGGEPRVRDVYPVLAQPPEPGALSGWIGRYAAPQPKLRFDLSSPLLPGGQGSVEAPLPERALEARDLPRRWARARVDYLLARIEEEGERREWVDEIIALSRRYKFVTPYTAFLAAPRSLLR